jgi:hypothetical protein
VRAGNGGTFTGCCALPAVRIVYLGLIALMSLGVAVIVWDSAVSIGVVLAPHVFRLSWRSSETRTGSIGANGGLPRSQG